MKPDNTKTKRTNFRFDPETLAQAAILAKKDKRSLNNWIEVLIQKEIEKNKNNNQ
jgi:predicted HicB family RNase H-like nuclease